MVTLQDARRVIAAAEAKASEIGQPMNIAVVDGGGNLISHVRMDGAWIGSIDISINKAFTSRAFDITTKDLADNSQSGDQFFGIHVSNRGRIMIFAGGIPLKRDGTVQILGVGEAPSHGVPLVLYSRSRAARAYVNLTTELLRRTARRRGRRQRVSLARAASLL